MSFCPGEERETSIIGVVAGLHGKNKNKVLIKHRRRKGKRFSFLGKCVAKEKDIFLFLESEDNKEHLRT